MSGLFRQPPATPKATSRIGPVPQPGMVDPTVELTQPGGPYLYGEVILTDGAGSYTIAPTLRPYFVSFKIPSVVGTRETVDCEHQGVNTAVVGFPVTLSLNLIGIAVALNKPLRVKDVYRIEIVRDLAEVVAVLEISGRERRFHVRNLSESIPAGAELSCRITNEKGSKPSTFSLGLITVELEA